MSRTTIHLDTDLKDLLRLEAQRRSLPVAELIRVALAAYLEKDTLNPQPGWGLFQSGAADTAQRAEEILAATGFGRHEQRRESPRE